MPILWLTLSLFLIDCFSFGLIEGILMKCNPLSRPGRQANLFKISVSQTNNLDVFFSDMPLPYGILTLKKKKKPKPSYGKASYLDSGA